MVRKGWKGAFCPGAIERYERSEKGNQHLSQSGGGLYFPAEGESNFCDLGKGSSPEGGGEKNMGHYWRGGA